MESHGDKPRGAPVRRTKPTASPLDVLSGRAIIHGKGRFCMASESTQKKLERVRKPRVHITYDVEIGDATVKKELPFVVGVLGDFSGNPTSPLKPLKDRKFIQVDRDNFNDIMARMTPGANMKVANTLKGDGSEMSVNLKFNSIEDFEPAQVAKQVEPLRKLLEQVLKNTESIKKLSTDLGIPAPTEKGGNS
jgi:type VI secretion system protein ImpB